MGAASALAVLGHQQNALLVPFVALLSLSAGRRRAGVYVAACGVTLTAAYVFLWLASGSPEPAAVDRGLRRRGLSLPGRRRARSRGRLAGRRRRRLASVTRGARRAPGLRRRRLGLLLAALRGTKGTPRAPRPDALRESAFARATLVLAGAAIWWEPQSLKYWVAVAVCGWLTLGLLTRRSLGGFDSAVLAMALAIPVVNLGGAIDRSRNHDTETIARRIGGATRPEDLLVVGTDLLGPSLRYHGERPHATSPFAVWYRATLAGEQGSTALRRMVDESRSRGGRVFVASNALDLDRARRERAGMTELGSDTRRSSLARGSSRPCATSCLARHERTLYEVLPAR